MTTTTKVTTEQAEAVLAAVRKQFRTYCATHAEIAEIYADDPELVDVLTRGNEPTQPVLREGWQFTHRIDAAPFTILWEDGPDGWAYNAIHGGLDEEMTALVADAAAEFGATTTPPAMMIAAADPIAGVETEPITGWALGIWDA